MGTLLYNIICFMCFYVGGISHNEIANVQISSLFGLLLYTSFGAWGEEGTLGDFEKSHMATLLCDIGQCGRR